MSPTSSAHDGAPPPWWRNAVVYQIYPRSFADGDGDGTGDLAGIRARLSYLVELGADAVWFTPWYASPLADGGYDVADYRGIDPTFGTLAEAEALIAEATRLGLRTIADIVPNHCSEQHPWFRQALAAPPDSPHRQRFWFRDGKGADGAKPPTGWTSDFDGGTWTRVKNPDGGLGQWYLHLFTPEQPDWNWNHPDVVAEHEEVLRFWFDRGVAGFRVDSATVLVKDERLPELTEADRPHPYVDRDEIHEIYRSWRRVADSYPEPRLLVGEVWLADPERVARYLRPDEFHTAFNFDFMTRPWNATALREAIQSTLDSHRDVSAPPTWVLSNHDITRPVTRFGRADTGFSFAAKAFGVATDRVLGTRRARAAALLSAALPGSLYIYQGDELGLPEAEDLPAAALRDPMHFRSGGRDPGRDGCRVPLPWNRTGPSFGFGEGEAWLPQPSDWGELSVAAQREDPGSMLNLYRAMLALRHREPGLRGEDFAWLDCDAESESESESSGLRHGSDCDAESEVIAFRRGRDCDAKFEVIAFRRGRDLACVVNLGDRTVPLPPHTSVLLASDDIPGDRLPADTAVWLRVPTPTKSIKE